MGLGCFNIIFNEAKTKPLDQIGEGESKSTTFLNKQRLIAATNFNNAARKQLTIIRLFDWLIRSCCKAQKKQGNKTLLVYVYCP